MANLATATISALNGTATASPLDNFGTAGFIISGSWTGTLDFEGSLDGVTFSSILAQRLQDNFLVSSTSSNGQFLLNTAGLYAIRVKMSSYTSGSATITIQANAITSFQRSLSTIFGSSDGTSIGNDSDRLLSQTIGKSVVDSNNSSSSLLTSSSIFTGSFTDTLYYSMISVNTHSDVASDTDGLQIEWSSDGTNIDDVDSFTIAANATKQFTFGTAYRYFRIKYTNSASNQTFFRLQTILHPFSRKASSHRLGESVSPEDDAELVKSMITGQDTVSGLFKNITSTDDRLNVNAEVTSIPTSFDGYLLDQNVIYSAAFEINAASSSLDNPLILFKNPSGSSKKILFLQLTGNSTISNDRSEFKIFSNPTVTDNGTSYTPKSRNIGGGASSSIAQVYSLPTVSADGDNLSIISSGENTNSQEIANIQQLQVQANNTILITAKPKGNNRVQAITIVWAELDV